jgi:hypothetical protein
VAVGDHARAFADSALGQKPTDGARLTATRRELVQVEVHGAGDVPLVRIARIAAETLELLERANVDKSDFARFHELC